jgi:hypothetical protein
MQNPRRSGLDVEGVSVDETNGNSSGSGVVKSVVCVDICDVNTIDRCADHYCNRCEHAPALLADQSEW